MPAGDGGFLRKIANTEKSGTRSTGAVLQLKRMAVWVTIVSVLLGAGWGMIPAAPGATPGPPETQRITLGLLSPAAFYWPNYAAEHEGFFKQGGLEIKTVVLGSPSTAIQALVGGSVDIAQAAADAFIYAISHGAAIRIIGQEIGNPAFSVVAQPKYTAWAQLKGASIAVSRPNDGAAIVFQVMAQANGLKSGDYTLVSVGTTPNRFAVLKSGRVDAAILTQPVDFEAIAEGFHLLGRSDQVLPHYSFMMIGAQTVWAAAHRKAVVQYLAALSRGADWLYTPANEEAAVAMLAERTQVAAQFVAKTYDVYIRNSPGRVVTRGEQIDMAGLQIYGQAMKDLGLLGGTVDAKRWVDSSYTAAAGR